MTTVDEWFANYHKHFWFEGIAADDEPGDDMVTETERQRSHTNWLAGQLEDIAKTILDVRTQEGGWLLEAAKILRKCAESPDSGASGVA